MIAPSSFANCWAQLTDDAAFPLSRRAKDLYRLVQPVADAARVLQARVPGQAADGDGDVALKLVEVPPDLGDHRAQLAHGAL